MLLYCRVFKTMIIFYWPRHREPLLTSNWLWEYLSLNEYFASIWKAVYVICIWRYQVGPCSVGLWANVQGPAVAMVPTKVPLIFCSQWCITKLRSTIPRPFERHCQELHFKIYSHLQVPIFSEISAKNDFYHNAAGQRAAILVSPLVCLRSTTLRMNGSHVITTVAHGTNTLSSRARTDQGGAGRRRAGHRRRAAGQLTFQCARRGWPLS